jgi:hypothetical protein
MKLRTTLAWLVAALLLPAFPLLAQEPTAKSPKVADIYRQLFQERMKNIERLRHYHERGVFPQNYDIPEQVPIFVDVHGTHCAMAQLVKESGAEDIVRQVVKLDNNIRVKDVKAGPFFEWMHWSGLTQEECARVQPSYRPRPDPKEEYIKQIQEQYIKEKLAEQLRVQEHLAQVEAELLANTLPSLKQAMSVLRTRNKELFLGKTFVVVAAPAEKTEKATLTLKNMSRSKQVEVMLTFLNGKGEFVKQQLPRFQTVADCYTVMLGVNQRIEVPYNSDNTWVVIEWTSGTGLNVVVPFQTVSDEPVPPQAKSN